MKCLNCGNTSEHYLCEACTTEETLDKIFNEIIAYKLETCENPYLAEFASGLEENCDVRECIPDILGLFDSKVTEYYYCRYYRRQKDPKFETAAIAYLDTHDLSEKHTQRILFDLLQNYGNNEFIKPKDWCEAIGENDNLCCELYLGAAEYFGKIGEYDRADRILDKAIEILNNEREEKLFLFSYEGMQKTLNKQKEQTAKWRKKAYWPSTEERRRAVAMFYDEKGIPHNRIETKPEKVNEDEFAPIKESYDEDLKDYCAFWCNAPYAIAAAKPIYEIAAVKVSNGEIADSFESFVRPWGGGSTSRQDAAKKANVPLSVIESADDVDIVMNKFFEFVGDDILVSTGALGNQLKLISRAARYAGMKEIKNGFYDLLDLAVDVSEKFDLDNNNREYLLSYFGITESDSALEKAQNNKKIYELLKDFDE